MDKRYPERERLQRERDARDLRVLELLDIGLLSQRAIALIVGCSQQHVHDLKKAAGE